MRPETRLLEYIDGMAPPVSAEEAMARRQQPSPGQGRRLAWALAVFVVVLAVGGLYLAVGGDDQVANPTPTIPATNPRTYSILDGEVTLAVAPPWKVCCIGGFDTPDGWMRINGSRDDHVVIATDPLQIGTGCENGSPVDAEAMARRIMADPNFETTEPVAVRIAGVDGLQMDADAARGDPNDFCWRWIPDQADRWRMRLYLVDYPGESAAVLTIAVIAAPEFDFERVLEEATPIVESLEIHTP